MSQDIRFDEEQSTARRAQLLGMTYINVSTMPERPLYKDLLSIEEMNTIRVTPLSADAHHITFGITTSTSQQTMQSIKQRFLDQQINFAIISDTGYREYMLAYNPPKKVEYSDIQITAENNDLLVAQVSTVLDQVRADDILAYLVQQAHRLNASDIHLETQEDHTRVRYRIDGVLHVVANLSPDKYRVLISAIASAADISTVADDAQQGHIAQEIVMADGTKVDVNVRLEAVPTITGIDAVMRLFNLDQSMYNLERLGLSPSERTVIDEIIAKPSGLVLVVGPTGSGKTTTLYSMLNTLNSDERKIITVEDPVEYRFSGISQLSVTTQNSKENSFAEKLRAVLRLDPDIIMVGEIRDNDTAKTALQAALTGHLVLSTFHASSASAAMTRLMDMIGRNPLFVSAIRLVMAQRLIRRLDPATKQGYPADEAAKRWLQQIVDGLPEGIKRPDLTNLTLYKPVPGPDNPYGYKGQIALREQFKLTPAVEALLDNGATAPTQEIEAVAIASGMKTMLQDGALKVIAGETTLEEILRVVG